MLHMAGQHGAVTIATNMAGRGTDIKLDDEARGSRRFEDHRYGDAMSPDVLIISCVDVPDVRETRVSPASIFRWKMI